MRFPFTGATYTSESAFVDHQRTINLMPEIVESGTGTNRLVLYPSPGFSTFCTTAGGSNPVRALFGENGRCFAVAGPNLYEIESNGTVTNRGSIADDGLPATISSSGDNGHQLWVVSGGSGYIFDLNTATLSAALMTGIRQGAYVDGYFLALDATNAKVYLSGLLDGLTWDPLDVSQRNTTGDRWQAMAASHREVWLPGSQRTDVWYNSGATFPFEPVSGTFIEHGILAWASLCILDNTLFWLGANEQGFGVVWRASGYTPTRISHHAVEQAIHSYTTVTDAIGFAFSWKGHLFYVLTFPTEDTTWVYDASTNLWVEWLHWNPTTEAWTKWPARCHAYIFGKHLVGSATTGEVWELSDTTYTDADGSVIRRLRRAPHLLNDHRQMFYSRAELLAETGTGTATYPNPRIGLQWSDDAGLTWSTIRWVEAGASGLRETRILWRRLGKARDRIFQVVADDGVPWNLIDLLVEVEPGLS